MDTDNIKKYVNSVEPYLSRRTRDLEAERVEKEGPTLVVHRDLFVHEFTNNLTQRYF